MWGIFSVLLAQGSGFLKVLTNTCRAVSNPGWGFSTRILQKIQMFLCCTASLPALGLALICSYVFLANWIYLTENLNNRVVHEPNTELGGISRNKTTESSNRKLGHTIFDTLVCY